MKNCLGIINLSENDQPFGLLSQNRPVAMLPFAGRYRLIDFTLSNMVNSGVTGVGVFTGSKIRSVMDHLGSGKPWDLDRKLNGLFLFTPTYDYTSIYKRLGDIELFYENKSFFKYAKQDYLFFTKSQTLANIDYKTAFDEFVDSGADIGLIYKAVTEKSDRFLGCDKLHLDKDGNFISVGTNLGKEDSFNLSMEMYFMKKEVFFEILESAIEKGTANFLKQAIIDRLDDFSVHTYKFNGYVSVIHTIKNYFNTNFEILNKEVALDLFFKYGQILTKIKDEPSTYYQKNARVKNAFIANGCQIDGYVENAIIFRGVKVEKGAYIKNSIIMQKSIVEQTVHMEQVILDKRVKIEEGVTLIGDASNPYIVGKKAVVSREVF